MRISRFLLVFEVTAILLMLRLLRKRSNPLRNSDADRRQPDTAADDITAQAPPQDVVIAARRRRISEAAYYRAQRRGFVPGFEDEDWLAAEKEIEARPS